MLFDHVWLYCFFCFKQKTAYELRISDWSSDVCSSDLALDLPDSARLGTGRRIGKLDLSAQAPVSLQWYALSLAGRGPDQHQRELVGDYLIIGEPLARLPRMSHTVRPRQRPGPARPFAPIPHARLNPFGHLRTPRQRLAGAGPHA